MRKYVSKVFAIATLFFGLSSQAQTPSGGTQPSFRMSGDATLMSNYVQRGLTHTKSDPALLASFWFNFGSQFRMGLSGSNVAYKNEDTHFNLKILSDIKINFSANSDLTIKYHFDRYFKSTTRDGDVFGLTLNTFGFKTSYEKFTNWEGTRQDGTWFGFGTEFDAFTGWKLDSTLGFTQNTASSVSDFFDANLTLKHIGDQLTWGAGITGTSSEITNRSGYFLVLSARVDY